MVRGQSPTSEASAPPRPSLADSKEEARKRRPRLSTARIRPSGEARSTVGWPSRDRTTGEVRMAVSGCRRVAVGEAHVLLFLRQERPALEDRAAVVDGEHGVGGGEEDVRAAIAVQVRQGGGGGVVAAEVQTGSLWSCRPWFRAGCRRNARCGGNVADTPERSRPGGRTSMPTSVAAPREPSRNRSTEPSRSKSAADTVKSSSAPGSRSPQAFCNRSARRASASTITRPPPLAARARFMGLPPPRARPPCPGIPGPEDRCCPTARRPA